MSHFAGLQTAVTGLHAHRRRIDIISENIVNVDTPGYHRQKVNLSAIDRSSVGVWTGSRHNTGGVEYESISRMRDAILVNNARVQTSEAEARSAETGVLEQLETIVGGLEEGSLHDQLNELWNAFDDLASAPDDLAMRQGVLQRAETVAQGFTRVTASIDQLRSDQEAAVYDTVGKVNALADQIAALDSEILGTLNTDAHPNSLLDQRDQLVTELAGTVNVQVNELENGQTEVTVDGQLIVSNGRSNHLTVQRTSDPVLGSLGYDRFSVVNASNRELRINSGQLAGALNATQNIIPQQRERIDSLIADLTTQVNALHNGGAGLDGSTGNDFFAVDPLHSGTLLVANDVVNQPEKVAAATAGAGVLDDSMARSLANLAESPTGPTSNFVTAVGELAAKVNTSRTRSDGATAAGERAQQLANSAGGVSLDEELVDLMTAQRSFEASARLVTAIDEMLQTLITSTGRVGR